MSASSDKLAKAISQLSFVNAIEHEQQASAINVLCRLKPGFGAQWAMVAERVLREAEKRQGTPDYWHTHIARVYMIRNNRLVYGWTFVVMADNPDKIIGTISNILHQVSQEISSSGSTREHVKSRTPKATSDEDEEIDNYPDPGLGEDDDYSEPDGPLPPGAVPEADERGNPIVPRSSRVHKIKMAGLSKNYDRNAPDPEKRKGSWQIESRKGKPFRPPVRN